MSQDEESSLIHRERALVAALDSLMEHWYADRIKSNCKTERESDALFIDLNLARQALDTATGEQLNLTRQDIEEALHKKTLVQQDEIHYFMRTMSARGLLRAFVATANHYENKPNSAYTRTFRKRLIHALRDVKAQMIADDSICSNYSI